MQIPLLAGREFTERDHASAPLVAVVTRRLAELLGPGSPVGREITLGGGRYAVIGVAADALSFRLAETGSPRCTSAISRAPGRPAR